MSDRPRLAIHDRPGGFSDRWVERCEELGISYEKVDCHQPEILSRIRGCDGLLWEWLNGRPEDVQCAPRVIPAAESMGMQVFPSVATCWHYDDKVAQKYALEAIEAPLIPTWVFYRAEDARAWIESTSFPKVFKLARGAGSTNVRLVRSAAEALALVRTAFSKGFRSSPRILGDARSKIRKHRHAGSVGAMLRRLPQTIRDVRYANLTMPRERCYVLFQEFVPDNTHDTRITVIGDRAFGFLRDVRPGDFRASGSGAIRHERDRVEMDCIRVAFDVSRRLHTQSLAFDFLQGPEGNPLIAEISYTYKADVVEACGGFWDPELEWRDGSVWPQDAILDDLLQAIARNPAPGS